MGHLYAAGVATSDSERLIQLGNQSPVAADDFPERFDYVALGHIHRPQYIAGQQRIRYSGSPIPLSFSERNDKKIVIELEIRDGSIHQVDHSVPLFRDLVRFKGSFEEVKQKAQAYTSSGSLMAFGELQIEEEKMNPAIHAEAAKLVADWNSDHVHILNYTITHTGGSARLHEQFGATADLRDIQPIDVLNRMMEEGGLTPQDQEAVRLAFFQLLEMEDETEES
jgi:exonuclease SbcD